VVVDEFDLVRLKDDRIGTVCDVVRPGVAFIVDFEKPMDDDFGRERGLLTYDTELIEIGDIAAAGKTLESVGDFG
jgi:hypothetical protein